jgi:hypothetical protein
MDIQCPIHTFKKVETVLVLPLERTDIVVVRSDLRSEGDKGVGRS